MSDSSSNDQLLQSAKLQIQLGQLDTAVSTLKTLLEGQPLHREGLYYLAVCQRKVNDHGARQTLDILKSAHPLYGRAYQEEGHLFKAESKANAAGLAYEQAVKLNPALLSSWKVLVSYRDSIGNRTAAKQAMQQVQWLSSLPPELLTVTSLIHEDKLYMAEQVCRFFLQKNQNHAEGMRLLAEIGDKLKMLDDAELLLARCIELEPKNSRARLEYVQILHKQQKFQLALEQAKTLNADTPNDPKFEVVLAKQTMAAGDFEQALKIYDQAINRSENRHEAYTAKGHALKTLNRADQAIKSYQRAYCCKADHGEVYWSLASLKNYHFSDIELDQMRTQERSVDISDNDRVSICFALGRAYEQRHKFSESFIYYEQGNRLRSAQSRFQAEAVKQEFEKHKALFTAEFFAEHQGHGHTDPAPIFIVGLPHGGSSFLGRILSSHSQVGGAIELPNIVGLANRLNGRKKAHLEIRYPEILTELRPEKFKGFGESFVQDTHYHRRNNLYTIDKTPSNFQHIALINLILPNAKIIDARQHPMACCFNNFTHLFAENQEFTYDLEEVGGYYQAYVDLMSHWQQALPVKILKVQYENLVADLPGQVERLLEFCELALEQQCVDFNQTEGTSHAVGAEPLDEQPYESDTQRWHHYEEFLQPLVDALGPSLQDY